MNRIEMAARSNTSSVEPLKVNAPSMPVSCTPAVVFATLVGTAAGAAISAYIVYGFDSGTPDSAGEITENNMQVSDLLSARRTVVAGIV